MPNETNKKYSYMCPSITSGKIFKFSFFRDAEREDVVNNRIINVMNNVITNQSMKRIIMNENMEVNEEAIYKGGDDGVIKVL